MYDTAVFYIIVVVSLPVFAYSAYTLLLLVSSLGYRVETRAEAPGPMPRVTVLLAVYNEDKAVEETLKALGAMEYPPERMQIIVADDSTDETVGVIDRLGSDLAKKGFDVVLSRRGGREGYKAGALNFASSKISGEYTLLIDADSRVTTGALLKAVSYLSSTGRSFVSFRVGHYNREENPVTRSFALFQDTIDGIQKMGSLRISAPFSFQGGFVMIRTSAISDVGYWKEGVLAEDADLSCRLFAAGHTGAYLSDAEMLSEDPGSLRVWKRQAARVAHGWAQCFTKDFSIIVKSRSLDPLRKLALLLIFLSPFAALSWIAVTLLTAYSLLFGIVSPSSSVYSNPVYLVVVTLPAVVFYLGGTRALHFRKMLTARNLALLPYLSYILSGTFAISGLSFAMGLVGRPGYFFRTPKKGASREMSDDAQKGEGAGVLLFEGAASVLALLAVIPVLFLGQYFLSLALLAFGLVTLKSMELSRYIRRQET